MDVVGRKVVKTRAPHVCCGEIWDDFQSYDLCDDCLKKVNEFLQESKI